MDRHSPDSPCSSPNLHRFAVSGNPEVPPRFVDGRRGGRLLAEQRKILRFPSSKRLLRLSKDLLHDWSKQRHALDFAA
jgi:hypothetical protein